MLRVERLNASYGPVQILHDINLSVAAGEIVALRREGALQGLSVDALAHVFCLEFALDQLRQDIQDLAPRIGEYAERPVDKSRRNAP